MKFRRKRRRKSNPAKRAAPRRAVRRRRRRSNPSMMPVVLANPHRPRQLRLRLKRTHSKWGLVKPHQRRTNPSRRRRRHVRHAGRFVTQIVRRRRRSNPVMGQSIEQIIRIGVAGTAGIVTARIASYLYNKYVAQTVRGSGESWRGWLNDVLRIVAMEAAVLGVERGLRKLNVGSPTDRMAFAVGGTAEAARQAIGGTLGRLSPGTDRGRFGLDGEPQGYLDENGTAWLYSVQAGRYLPAEGMGAILDEEEYGFSGVVPRTAFTGN